MTRQRLTYLLCAWMAACIIHAQDYHLLTLPHQEQLPSKKVTHFIEDREGFLWYATEGGGICRDDGRQVDIFRSDNNHPDLLGTNDVACLAELQSNIIIGTFHGAYLLDKKDYSIRHIQEVDDKRVDAICVASNGHYWLTSNKKVYEFSADHQLLNTYSSLWKGSGKYVSHLYEDSHHRLWVSQWDGGLLRWNPSKGHFDEMPWPMDCSPSAIMEDTSHHCLWIGTIGQGIVCYQPHTGKIMSQPQAFHYEESQQPVICIDLLLNEAKKQLWMTTTNGLTLYDTSTGTLRPISLSHILPNEPLTLNRLSLDHRGNVLVAGSLPHCFVISQQPSTHHPDWVADGNYLWQYHERQGIVVTDTANGRKHNISYHAAPLLPFMEKRKGKEGIWATNGSQLLSCTWDSVTVVTSFPSRPNTLADDGQGHIWLTSNRGLERLDLETKETVVIDTNLQDISSATFTPDGTLWLANIYGQLYRYENGTATLDEYGSNEYGDAITQLSIDSLGNLIICCDRYIRYYDTHAHTLRSESMANEKTYSIHLATTQPFCRWSEPTRDTVIERLPRWMGSWWAWCIYISIAIALLAFFIHYMMLRHQRHLFLEQIKQSVETPPTTQEQTDDNPHQPVDPQPDDTWLSQAIEMVERNISNEHYSVEQLSSDLCMSRMTFYRKIQAFTGQKPTEFVRTIRLRRAAALLQEGKLNVTEISYATGFSSVSYFSRCFRTMFGIPPTQFGKATTADSLLPNDTPS